MSKELAIATRSATSILQAKTPEDHQIIDDQLSVVQDIMRRLGMDKKTQDKVGAIRVWNMRKLRRVLDQNGISQGTRTDQLSTDGTKFNSQSKLAKQVNEIAKWPLDEWLAWRNETMDRDEDVLTAHGAYGAAKYYRLNKERAETEVEAFEHPDILLFNADFRHVLPQLDSEVAAMIFTDPPYSNDHIVDYRDMADLSRGCISDGGSLIAYCGHYAIPKIVSYFNQFKDAWRFWWMLAVNHTGGRKNLVGKDVRVHWKPMLWYVKGGRYNNELVDDMVVSRPPQKNLQDWEQSDVEAEYYIHYLSEPGDWIIDPFMGSGTTGIAALKQGRKFIGIEIDEQRFAVAQKRLKTWLQNNS